MEIKSEVKTWEVTIWETIRHTTTVEASSDEEAYDKAHKVISSGYTMGYETEAEGYTGHWEAEEL
jgi:hypothetical protein